MTARRRSFIPAALAVLAAAAFSAPVASAGVSLRNVDVSAYPNVRLSIVTSKPSTTPPTVAENGRPVTALTSVNLGREKSVVLAIDRSKSMKGASLDAATAAARTFVADKPQSDQVEILAFGHRAYALTRFSSSPTDADAALSSVAVDGRIGTALYDSVVLAADQLNGQSLAGRAIILLTDGADVSSTASLDDAVAAARRAQASVYAIGIAGRGFRPGPLRQLAHETGGTYHVAGSTAELQRIYNSIGRELARTWRVSYLTTSRPGDTVALQVTFPGYAPVKTTAVIPGAPSETAPAPGPLPGSIVRSPLSTLALGAAVAGLVLLAFGVLASAREGTRLRRQLDPHVASTRTVRASGQQRRKSGLGVVFRATERVFGHRSQWQRLQRLLERADVPLRTVELVYAMIGTGFVVGLVAAVGGAPTLLILAALALGAMLPVAVVARKASKRLRTFDEQLPDVLITIAASLKAGHSFRQGIQTVAEEGQAPASDEFKRVLTETSLGRPMDDALHDMVRRVPSANLEFSITAVTIQRQVGGSLASLFDLVADSVRQRQAFGRKIRSLTAMGRMSAYVLVGLPIFLAAILTLINRSYMSPLWHGTTGHEVLGVGIVMIAIGSTILRKIVSFKG